MDYLMGIRGKDFVMVVADTTAVQQIITIKHDEEKIVPVDTDSPASSQKLLAMAGEPGDRVQVCHVVVFVMSHGCCDSVAAAQADGYSQPACLSSLQFSEFIIANVRLYALRNDSRLSTHAVAHFTRRELATALRKVRTCRASTPYDCAGTLGSRCTSASSLEV